MLPPIPAWDGLHPLIVHFPIGLLLIVPVFLALALAWPKNARCFGLSALILMTLGTIAAFVAVSTGEAAGELAERTPEITAAIEAHEEMGETARNVFFGLSILYAALLFLPGLLKKELDRKWFFVLNLVFLVLYLAGAVVLAHTGHLGGRLVHEFGIQALL